MQGRYSDRPRWCAPLSAACALAAVALLWAGSRSVSFSEPRSSAPCPSRREAVAALIPGLAVTGAVLTDADSAWADGSIDLIVGDSRKKAKYESREGGFLGANKFKKQTQDFNYTDLQSFLPKLYMARRSFEVQNKQLNDRKVDVNNPETYALLRNVNRDEPVRRLRKELFRAQQWVKYTTEDYGAADTEYDRVRRALDEEDSQFLLLSRFDGRVPTASVRTARRNLQAIVDALDDLLALVPTADQEAAKTVAESRVIPTAKLPLRARKPQNATNATSAAAPSESKEKEDDKSTPSNSVNLGNASSIPFGSMAMDTRSD